MAVMDRVQSLEYFRSSASRVARSVLALVLAGTALLGSWPVAADNGIGGWSALAKWPLIPIHAVLLGDGRVMTYGTDVAGTQTGRFIYDIWDPRQGLTNSAHRTLPNTTVTDLFCSAQLVLPSSGEVFIAGGDLWDGKHTRNEGNADSVLFDPAANALRQGTALNRARYYATATTLSTGEIYVQGGRGLKTYVPGDGGAQDRPEIRDADGSFRLLPGVDTASLYFWYPRNWVAPDGRIFGYSDRSMYYVDPYADAGSGALVEAGTMVADGPSGASSSEVMFAPGRILRVGGGGLDNRATETGKSAAAVVDINGTAPVVTPTNSMPLGLHWHTATVIADGRVVVTGGSLMSNQLVGVSTRALLWDPNTGNWTEGAQGSGRSRLYHSTALLLPDATVLVGGGGARGPQTNLNAERYYPPYLYTASGAFAPRLKITAAPARITWGTDFVITVSKPWRIRKVTLIKAGSVTHSFNMEQRYMELPFKRSGSNLRVTAPANAALAPPGPYLLFAIDVDGVPTVARLLSL